jgi:hypothetical protein
MSRFAQATIDDCRAFTEKLIGINCIVFYGSNSNRFIIGTSPALRLLGAVALPTNIAGFVVTVLIKEYDNIESLFYHYVEALSGLPIDYPALRRPLKERLPSTHFPDRD